MELSLNEKKYLKKVIKKYPKKKIYKLIKKKDNLEISNDLKSLLTKMENVNFMDNYYEDMIGGMNSFLNMNRTRQRQPAQGPQPPQPQSYWSKLRAGIANAQTNINQGIQSTQEAAAGIAPAVGNRGPNVQSMQEKGNNLLQATTQRVKGAAAGIAPAVQNSLPNVQSVQEQGSNLLQATAQRVKNLGAETQAGIVNTQRNVTEGAASLSSSLSELKSYMDNPNKLQNLIDNVQGKVGEFVLKIQNMVKLSANLTYDNKLVSEAVETYLFTLGVPSPFNKLFGRIYFNFVIKPYIQSTLQSTLQTYPKPYIQNTLQTYPIHYNEQNLVESPISDMYNNNINSYAPHMYYPINYNSIEKYPMDNYDGYYN